MDAIVNGIPVTPRTGYNVEINALWFNAIHFAMELAEKAGDSKFANKWKKYPELVKKSFIEMFWSDEKKYLADYVNEQEKSWYVRPNQVFCSLIALLNANH
jgi:predicted glycogen debranching enzyme